MTHTDDVYGRHHHDPAELHNEDVAHEHTDVNIRAILMFAVGLAIVALVVHVLMAVMFGWLERQAARQDPVASPMAERAPDMPRNTTESAYFGHARGGAQLLTNEPMALQKLIAEENKRLQGYGWIEGKTGVAYMPLAEAKKLILERGVPVRAGDPVEPTVGTRAAAMGEASGGRAIQTGRKAADAPAGTTPPAQPPQQPPAAPHGAHQPGGGHQ